MLLILLIFLFSQETFGQNVSIKNFSSAKEILEKVYGLQNMTFYCACPYQKKTIKTKKCELKLKKYKKRLKRLEWEHVVPAHAFGHSFREWRENKKVCLKKNGKFLPPRKCAQTVEQFRLMEADIYNLVPAVGAVNAIRNKLSMAQLSKSNEDICQGVMLSNNKFMPPDHRKGDVARIYMYMHETYPGRGVISDKNQKLFLAWDKMDPVDKEECLLNLEKQKFQKNINQVVMSRCEKQLKNKGQR